MLFEDLDLNPEILESIDYMGFRETTPVQEMAIPVILTGSDLIACAQTGTGKTAAFLLPIMNHISENRPVHTHTLILVPTRELALQIDQQVQGLAYTLNITSIAVYGGGDGSGWDQEKSALSRGADIIVATPGRLISHLNQGYVKFNEIEVLVLDEADRMLDIGFYDDIMKIISHLPKKKTDTDVQRHHAAENKINVEAYNEEPGGDRTGDVKAYGRCYSGCIYAKRSSEITAGKQSYRRQS
jgi:superfamily II DNA/RNA helicase